MKNRLYPIGTVVRLKDNRDVCIIGYSDNALYYIGCPYPTGLKNEKTINFSDNDIDNVFFIGYQNEYVLNFTKVLKVIVDKLNEEEVL